MNGRSGRDGRDWLARFPASKSPANFGKYLRDTGRLGASGSRQEVDGEENGCLLVAFPFLRARRLAPGFPAPGNLNPFNFR
jgi:hypothetical protein